MKKKVVTLPELVKLVGSAQVAKEVGCDSSLPRKWARGQRPSWKNLDTLLALADKCGVTLHIYGAQS